MILRLIVAGGLIVVAVLVSVVIRRRRPPDAPSQPRSWAVPAQVDRSDFSQPTLPWLVVVFSSATCEACASMVAKARVLASKEVAVEDVEYGDRVELHRRYNIEAVPTVLVVDGQGIVRRSFLGPVSATDLWASVAEARSPGSSPEPELGL